MATIPIVVKHGPKRYNVDLDPTTTGEVLKFQIYSLTGVEPDRQSILVSGKKVKDDTFLSELNAKPKQLFLLVGSASAGGSALTVPTEKPRFVEDMTEAEIAKMEGAIPAGLNNTGNTCYLNATLQVLRSVPELQDAIATYKAPPSTQTRFPNTSLAMLSEFGLGGLSSGDFVSDLRDLLKSMSETLGAVTPTGFLRTFRREYPQFDMKDKHGGHAQQDAEEAWSQIIHQVKQKTTPAAGTNGTAFVDKYMAGRMHSELKPPAEVGDHEVAIETDEIFFKVDCHVTAADIHHLTDGIKAGLTETVEKRSEFLDRNADYTKESRISRLPKYLAVHMIRFFWKKDISKKAKILKKVSFQEELDMVEYCTEDLKKRLLPVREKVRDWRKDEQDMERARKRQKIRHKQEEDRKHDEAMKVEAAPIAKLREQKEKKEVKNESVNEGGDLDAYKTDEQYEQEKEAALNAAKKALYDVIDPELAADDSANKSGLYELRGVVCHQGASADSGHYTSFVKKEGKLVDDPKAFGGKRKEEDGKWWYFNDDKVSEVEAERIQTLAGGGEAASALILLYRAIPLPTKEEIEWAEKKSA